MSKYEVYQMGTLQPVTVVEADAFEVDYDKQRLVFRDTNNPTYNGQKYIVAMFNWNNIAGFKEIEEDKK